MTEPTHEIRRDVAALLDIQLARILVSVGTDDLELAREKLRAYLSRAWHDGWRAGYYDGHTAGQPSPNPYHETDIA